MLGRLIRGERVIVGTQVEVAPGYLIGQHNTLRLVVTRRSTREEFLAHAPVGADVAAAEPSAAFYWELGIGAAKRMTVTEFERFVIHAVFAALRKVAPDAPGATPEFLTWYGRILEVSEAGLTSHILEATAHLLNEAGVEIEVEGLDKVGEGEPS